MAGRQFNETADPYVRLAQSYPNEPSDRGQPRHRAALERRGPKVNRAAAQGGAGHAVVIQVDFSLTTGLMGLVRSYKPLAYDGPPELALCDPESRLGLRLLPRSRMTAAQHPGALYLVCRAPKKEPGVPSVHESATEIYDRSGRSERRSKPPKRLPCARSTANRRSSRLADS